MRVGLVTDCYHPTMNGVTGVVALLTTGLQQRGHHVTLVAPRGPGRPGEAAARGQADGYPPATVERWSLPALPSIRLRVAPASAHSMQHLIRQHGLELLHTHTEGTLGLAARNAALAAGIPVVHTLHTFYRHYLHYAPLAAAAPHRSEHILQRWLGWFLGPYDRVVAPSPAAADHVADVAPGVHTVSIPNGLGPAPAGPAAGPRPAHDEAEDARLLLCVGRIAPEKRSRELTEALSRQLAGRADVRAMLVGGGPLLDDLRGEVAAAGLQDRIMLPGYLPHREVLALYRRASVLVSASLSENHPLTLLEAAAAGLPLAVRRHPYLGGLGIDAEAAIVADDDTELVGRAVALLDDPAQQVRLGASARRTLSRFTAATHLDRTERLYGGLLAGHPASTSGDREQPDGVDHDQRSPGSGRRPCCCRRRGRRPAALGFRW